MLDKTITDIFPVQRRSSPPKKLVRLVPFADWERLRAELPDIDDDIGGHWIIVEDS